MTPLQKFRPFLTSTAKNYCGRPCRDVILQDIIAISCSWCKTAYHNKVSCFMLQQIEEQCTMGVHSNVIIPPSWIIKLPRKVSL